MEQRYQGSVHQQVNTKGNGDNIQIVHLKKKKVPASHKLMQEVK